MWAIKNIGLIDYLWDNGIKPEYERYELSFFRTSEKLRNLIDRYFIETVCIPNRGF